MRTEATASPRILAVAGHASTPAYRPDVDGLRAIAVASVVLFHAFPKWLPGGFIGVDVFFVISGFLISGIILREMEDRRFSLLDFYRRRALRIFPALILVIAATLIFGWITLLTDEFRQLGRHAAGGIGFIANFLYLAESGYFDSASETKPLLHLWSLGIEEQFYVVWPLTLLAIATVSRRRLGILLGVILVASLIANVIVVQRSVEQAFFLPIYRFWELLVGAAIAVRSQYFQGDCDALPERYRHALSLLGLALIAASAFWLDENIRFPGWWALLPVSGSAMLIAAGRDAIINRSLLSTKPLVWIGLISYPLYLWHWPLISYLWIIEGGLPSRDSKVLAVIAAFALAWLTYRYVELPIRFGRSRDRAVSRLAVTAIMIGAAGISVMLGAPQPRHANPVLQEYIDASKDFEWPEGLVPIVLGNAQALRIESPSDKVTLLIGDSHVQHYASRVRELSRRQTAQLNTTIWATMGGCPPIPEVKDWHNEPHCSELRDAAFAAALRPEVESVVLAGCWNCYFIRQAQPGPAPPGQWHYHYDNGEDRVSFRQGNGSELAMEALESALKRLTLTGKRVFLILDNPNDERLDPKFYITGNRMSRSMSPSVMPSSLPASAREKELNDRLMQIGQRAGANVIDPRSRVCTPDHCLLRLADGTFVYQDANHFSATFVRTHGDFLDVTVLSDPE